MFAPRSAARSSRRVLVVTALVGALTLSACSSADSAADAAAGAAETGTWTYESDFGPVELPADIERIVSVDFYTPAALIDLGVTPVGVVNSYFTEGTAIPDVYKDAIEASDAISIGEYYEMNLEAVAQAAPDVIIATNDFLPIDSELRPELEKIAPIITFTARDGESWRTRATELADILDKEEELAPIAAEYDAARDALKEKYADVLAVETFTVLVPVADEWGTYADTHFATPILRDLGATFREQEADEVNEAQFPNWFSYESIDRLANASVIFKMVNEDGDKVLAENTIWQNLPAVQAGKVFEYIPLSPTGSYGWALQNLEDLDALFAEVQTASAAE